jgi:Flp pilus assembly protein CpaB
MNLFGIEVSALPLKIRLKRYMHVFTGLALAVAAFFTVQYYIDMNVPSVKVVTAETRLSVGTTIGPQHIKVTQIPKSVLPPDAITDAGEVLGKTVVLGVLLEGDVIRKEHVAAGKGGLAARLAALAPGRQACDLPPETAQGLRGLLVGDRVDIYSEVGVGDSAAKTAASAVKRVAREAVVLRVPGEAKEPSDSLSPVSMDKGSYVVALNPGDEAREVAEAVVKGRKFSVMLLSGREEGSK